MERNETLRGWLKIKNAAKYVDMSQRTVRGWLKEGLRHTRVKGTILIKTEWLDGFLESFECKGEGVDEIVNELTVKFRKDLR